MSLPNNLNWGNRNNGASSNEKNNSPLGLQNMQKVAGFSYKDIWQQQPQQSQEMATGPQPMFLHQDQQTYYNNNVSPKHPPMTVSQNSYQLSSSSSWNQPSHFMQQHSQQQQQMQQQYSNNSNPYSYKKVSNTPEVFNSSQQINFANSNPAGRDPWNWGWDDSSNNSPATSFSTNNNNFQNDSTWNWNVDDSHDQTTSQATYASNFFQQGNNSLQLNQNFQKGNVAQIEQLMHDMNIQPNSVSVQNYSESVDNGYYENQGQITPNLEIDSKILNSPKVEPVKEICTKALVAENLAEVNLKTSADGPETGFDVKSESGQSFLNQNMTNVKELKTERFSPDSGQSGGDAAESVSDIKSEYAQSYQSGTLSSIGEFKAERLSPESGRELISSNNADNSAMDVSTPPPGLDRMVLGQLTENENDSPSVPEVGTLHHHIHRHDQDTPPPGLHRMVLGQLTDDQNPNSTEENQNMASSLAATDDIPPPGFHRMIPGESSSPETQNVIQLSIDSLPREQRVVTGVARDEIDVANLQTSLPSSSPPTPANRLSSPPTIPEESRIQFQSERCEIIGSDNVDNYAVNTGDSGSVKSSKRKENKDRDRHLDDITSDEGDRDQGRRREKDAGYYSQRGSVNREREESPHRERRYRDRRSKGRDLLDWERDRRSESPGRYRDEKDRRRDYRDDRRRHVDQYYSDDEDADTNGYYSDRDQRNMSGYREDYDRTYPRRDDRARSLRPEKLTRERNDERGSGKDRRRGDYGDRDRNRDRDRDRDRDRQSDYYRRRGHDEVDDYRDSQRSRPSSRNDSVLDYKHRGRPDYEEDRDRGRDRMDRYRNHSKRDRDMFYPGYNYDPAYYNYYYQYCENLRRTNPAAYAEWCRKYYAHSQHGTFDGSYTEDRGSVHSGRSSANEENKDRYTQKYQAHPYGPPQFYPCHQTIDQVYPYHNYSSDLGDHDGGRRLDLQGDKSSVAIQRLTPAKFTTAHVKGSLTPRGQLIKILAHYPLDGQPATLEIHEQLSCQDDLRKELQDFPGPLVRGVTHKNNILRYCKQKIKDADANPSLYDKESYKLIWELLMLLIRQNGTVVGTDIAELLMTNRTAHSSINKSSSPSGSHHNSGEASHHSTLSEEEVTNQFRDYLIYGNSKEALEWAMKHGLWGHALFLASKMDQRTYASVMTRFANGLTMNDPLQTLYQLMSGRQPASVTCCADEKWGDWRPHLAMILSNSSTRPELDVKTVTTLGDTLGARGNLHAAHFCYLMAQLEFGTYSHKSSKIVLIGSSHALPFNQFCTNEAIFATEIFEFACSLADPEFTLHHLQVYKLLVAKRLMEVGLVQEAVHYAEVIANTISKHPAHYSPQFIQEVYDVGNMLKYSDPVYNNAETSEGSSSDPQWLSRLLNVLNDYQIGILQHDAYGSASNLTTYSENENVQSLPLDVTANESVIENQTWQQQQQQQHQQQQQLQQQQQQLQQQQQHQQQQQLHQQRYYDQMGVPQQQNECSINGLTQSFSNEGVAFVNKDQSILVGPPAEESNQSYWSNVNHWTSQQKQGQQQENETMYSSGVGEHPPNTANDMYDNKQHGMYEYFEGNSNEVAKPLITLPNSKPRTLSQSSSSSEKLSQAKPKSTKAETSKNGQSGSWFGGIFNKLPFRPKNQMILPDDKNPSIVWDSDKKRWVNLDGDEDGGNVGLPPPPKASDLSPASVAVPYAEQMTQMPVQQQQQQQQSDVSSNPNPPISGSNKYKMNRGKSFRSNYVDVMNPGGVAKAPNPVVAAPELFPSYNYSPKLPTNYFIPAPVENNENAPTDFLTPSTGSVVDSVDASQPQALSRWSSTSSLSREVQKYTFKQARTPKTPGDDYLPGNNQWSGVQTVNVQRVAAGLPRMKGYPK